MVDLKGECNLEANKIGTNLTILNILNEESRF